MGLLPTKPLTAASLPTVVSPTEGSSAPNPVVGGGGVSPGVPPVPTTSLRVSGCPLQVREAGHHPQERPEAQTGTGEVVE